MRRLASLALGGLAALASHAATAADLPIAAPFAPVIEDFGNWYLRGDVGFSNQIVKNLRYGRESAYTPLTSFNQVSAFDTAGIFGVGVGYQINNWFRADVTGQYRGNSNFKATDRFTGTAGGVAYSGIDNYSATKSEWLLMGNLYADLGTWYGFTPFIGGGVGVARVTISNFSDVGTNNLPFTTTSFATAPTGSKWNLAWAAHAGVSYRVQRNLSVELGYSYLYLGDGVTGALSTYNGITTNNIFRFRDITSHDLKIGLRWNFEQPAYSPPLIRKG